MAAPGNFDMEALQVMLKAMFETFGDKHMEKIDKIDQNIAELKEDNKNINNKIEQQSEKIDQKLEQQSENFKQDTIKITEGLENVKQDTIRITKNIAELKIDNMRIKQSIIDCKRDLTEEINETNVRIDTLENTCKLALHEQAMKCENTHKTLRLECREYINELHETINKQLSKNTSKQDEKIQSAIDRLENKIDMVTSKIKYTNKYENVYELMAYQKHQDIRISHNVETDMFHYTQNARIKHSTSPQTRVNYHTKYKTRTCEIKRNRDKYNHECKLEIKRKHCKFKCFGATHVVEKPYDHVARVLSIQCIRENATEGETQTEREKKCINQRFYFHTVTQSEVREKNKERERGTSRRRLSCSYHTITGNGTKDVAVCTCTVLNKIFY
jgi:hypothetical protein